MLAISCLNLLFWCWQEPVPSVQEELTVSFVLLDVVAADRKGRPVDDLKASDFVVSEDAKEIEVAYFDTLDYRQDKPLDFSGIPEEHRPQLPDAKPSRQIILALDLEELRLFDAKKAFDHVAYFLESLDPANHRYAINLYSLESGSLTHGFVEDPQLVLDRLNTFRDRFFSLYMDRRDGLSGGDPLLLGDNDGGGLMRWERPAKERRSITENGNVFTELEQTFRDCSLSANRVFCIEDALRDYMAEHRFRTEALIGGVEMLTRAFEENKGLKMLFLVSPGFAFENMYSAVDLARVYGVNISLDSYFTRIELDNDFRKIMHACIKNRVMFHTFDIFNTNMDFKRSFDMRRNGPANSALSRIYRTYVRDVTHGLKVMADDSGGAFHSTPLKKSMNEALDRSRFFYVLGYNSPKGRPGEYRKIKVSVNRKGVKLRYRKGYFGGN